MKTKYADLPKPPVCLHILGQGLIDAMWQEMQEMKKEIEKLKTLLNAYQADERERKAVWTSKT